MESEKLKISLLVPSKGVSGGLRSTVVVGNELLSRGHDVRIFYRENAFNLRRSISDILKRFRYSHYPDWITTFKGTTVGYNKLHAAEFPSDEIIISMCAETTLDMWSLPKTTGIKLLYCRGAEIENWENMLKAWKLPVPKIAVSNHVFKMMTKEARPPLIGVVPNGINTKEYYPSVQDSERTNIGAILGSSRPKDPASTIRVMQMLGTRLPSTPRYLFSHTRRPKGIRGVQFKRLPTLPEARRIYSSCRVWFLASISEGFPNPLLEAMACGCAVVSTDCGGSRDIIEDGFNGFIVGVGNTGEMVHKITMLYKDDKLRKRICTNAMNTVRELTWPKAVDKLEGYIYSLYNKSICPESQII